MFTKLLFQNLKRAAVSYSCFSSLPKPIPMKTSYMETTNLLMKTTMLSSNLHIQNLLEFLQKCQQQLQGKSESNSLNQISLVSQGKAIVSIISLIDLSSNCEGYLDIISGVNKSTIQHLVS